MSEDVAGSFRPNPAFRVRIEEDVVDPDLRRRAENVLRRAQDTAQVDTGAYRESLKIVPITDAVGYGVLADVDYAAYLEFGTRNAHAYRTLGRALDAARE